ncbi:MAG: threonylcarbamoyl-AMP synthase [Bryobacterales bacterium]|nr:threonylcarbamoyl-AMP synthase [Bryobacterales bacterium]
MASPSEIARAAAILRRGGLVAFPTETVYGLGANALDEEAVDKIYRAKGRPAQSPLIVHVHSVAEARRYAAAWPGSAQRLADAFWPGPLTMVLPKTADIPPQVTAGLDTVGLRVPAHPVALDLLKAAELPVAAPSANRFMGLSPTLAAHVRRSLATAAEMVLEGGPSAVGLESTVVSLAGEQPLLLRPGAITAKQLGEVLGVEVQRAVATAEGAHAAPGMHPRHYSPRTPLRLLSADDPIPEGHVVWVWWKSPRPANASIELPSSPQGYARSLYRALHDADDLAMDLIAVECPPGDAAWLAIWDRLLRAQS